MSRHHPALLEEELQAAVVDLARWRGWLIHAERPARTARGWVTPVQGHVGWPDLVLLSTDRLLVVELKSDRGRLSADQERWLTALRGHGHVEVAVWRPSDLRDGTIAAALGRGAHG